jgi:PHP-associated
VRPPALISAALLALATAAGTWADRPLARPPVMIAGYRVLAVDFHTHSSTWSDGALTPWGLVLEAERHGLDAIAITGHNQVSDGQLGRWFARRVGGPIVLAGEEIVNPKYHMIAAGIEEKVSFLQSASSAIDAIHRQGGIAIAAHPMKEFWAGWDDGAMRRLDGAEICHPLIFSREGGQRDFEQFAARAPVAAIGSSDYHGLGEMGLCRTYVFARENSARGILEAVRAHRTVVYGRDGQAYGDPTLVQLAASDGRLRAIGPSNSRGGPLDWLSRIGGVLGLAGLVAFTRRSLS